MSQQTELQPTLDYLQTTQTALLAETHDFDLNYAPSDGGWSAGQVLAHLIRTEKTMHLMFWMGLKSGLNQKALDIMDHINTFLWKLNGMTYNSNGETSAPDLNRISPNFKGRFVAPGFLRPARKNFAGDALLARRAKARARTINMITRVPFAKLADTKFSHPILGRFTLLAFVEFIGKHEEWHTLQIKRIRADREKQLISVRTNESPLRPIA